MVSKLLESEKTNYEGKLCKYKYSSKDILKHGVPQSPVLGLIYNNMFIIIIKILYYGYI